jgi:ankyrin repeat protein
VLGSETDLMKDIPSLLKLVVGATLVVLACSRPAVCGEIHDASQTGDLTKVKALLSANPELVSSKTNGWTPLHLAAMYGRKDVVEFLLKSKADINGKDKNGETALHFAAMLGHHNLAELLLANKAEVDARDNDGETPLFYAARKEIAELLLNNKANVNVKNKKGFTPLHEAVEGGKKGVAATLRQHGGETSATDNAHLTRAQAIDIAVQLAAKDKVRLKDYGEPQVLFNRTTRLWLVSFFRKNIGSFDVSIDDETQTPTRLPDPTALRDK